jgi:SET domain-containing protein
MPRAKLFPPFPPTEEEEAMIRNMEIKQSNLPNAGRGVFTKAFIPKGTFLGYYRGKIVDLDKVKDMDYVLTINDGTSICGKHSNHFSALLNCPTATPYFPNVEFSQDGKLNTISDVKAGQELYVDYGRAYWTGRPELLYDIAQNNIRKTRRLKKGSRSK